MPADQIRGVQRPQISGRFSFFLGVSKPPFIKEGCYSEADVEILKIEHQIGRIAGE